jgi:hypothetical protein
MTGRSVRSFLIQCASSSNLANNEGEELPAFAPNRSHPSSRYSRGSHLRVGNIEILSRLANVLYVVSYFTNNIVRLGAEYRRGDLPLPPFS